jgi:hypothetical protein
MARNKKQPPRTRSGRVKAARPGPPPARKRSGPKGYPPLQVELKDRDAGAFQRVAELVRDRFIINEGDGPLPHAEVLKRFPLPTPEDIDSRIEKDLRIDHLIDAGELEEDAEAKERELDGLTLRFSSSDTRPLRDILGWRGNKPKPRQPAFSRVADGKRLQPAERFEFARDVAEVLELAHALLIDSDGRTAAFDYELQMREKLAELAAAHRGASSHYREKARTARMLVDLHDIYAVMRKAWQQHEKKSRRRGVPPGVRQRLMDEQRDALRRFCRDYRLSDDEYVPLLERDGLEIRKGKGPAKEAARALEKVSEVALAGTIAKSLDISPFEMKRSARAPICDAGAPPRYQYDAALRVVQEVLEVLTSTPLPAVSADTAVPGWPLMKAEVLQALYLTKAPADNPEQTTKEVAAQDRLADDLLRFLLKTVTSRPALLEELGREFVREVEKQDADTLLRQRTWEAIRAKTR